MPRAAFEERITHEDAVVALDPIAQHVLGVSWRVVDPQPVAAYVNDVTVLEPAIGAHAPAVKSHNRNP